MSYQAALDPKDDSKVNINATCPICFCRSFIRVSRDKFLQWVKGEFIQDVWPELDDGQRELIKTGTHPDCWEEAFKDLEKDEL